MLSSLPSKLSGLFKKTTQAAAQVTLQAVWSVLMLSVKNNQRTLSVLLVVRIRCVVLEFIQSKAQATLQLLLVNNKSNEGSFLYLL